MPGVHNAVDSDAAQKSAAQVTAHPVGRNKKMRMLNRLKYAFFVNVVILGVGVVIAMIFGLDIGDMLFSGKVFYPLLAINLLIAPFLEKYLKFR